MRLYDFLLKNRGLLAALSIVATFIVLVAWSLGHSGNATMPLVTLELVPLALVLGWLFVTRMDISLLLIALLTPFAVNVDMMSGMELSLPVEPLMILFTLIFLFRVLLHRKQSHNNTIPQSHNNAISHPVTLLVLAMLTWMTITSLTSEMPWVSIKYTLARVWFTVPFFFAATLIFRNPRRIRQFFWAYMIGLCAVVLITTVRTLGNFSDLQTLHRVMRPFYNDHTAYGCVIALMLPTALFFVGGKEAGGKEIGQRRQPWYRLFSLSPYLLISITLFALLCIGLFLSYCRAAWISVAGAVGIWLLVRTGMKIKWMMLLFGLGVGLFFVHQGDVLYKLGKNKQDSSYTLADQVKSISNISTDASNLERLNRWASAIRMWKEDPLMGCGPGTYQFLYGRHQRSYQLSTISTNAGNLGNAHSEYIGPCAESGIVGMLTVFALLFCSLYTGIRTYNHAHNPTRRLFCLMMTLALVTYFVHGTLNNFLDTDKLSLPFWGAFAVITVMSLKPDTEPDAVSTAPQKP